MHHFRAKERFNFFWRGGSVFDDIMQNAGSHAFRIQFHISENPGHLEGMGQVRFTGKPHLAFVNPGRINIGAFNDIQVGIRYVITNLIDYIGYPNQCTLLISCNLPLVA